MPVELSAASKVRPGVARIYSYCYVSLHAHAQIFDSELKEENQTN